MAGRQRTLELILAIDDSQVGKGIQNIDKNVDGMSKRLSKAGSAIKVGFAAAVGSGVVNVGRQLVDLAVTGESVRRRFDTVFGDYANTMGAWIDAQNEAFGVSEVRLKGMAAGIQDLLVPMGFARTEAAGMTQTILETANALSEWTAGSVSVEQAVDAVSKALLGEREQLKSLGVSIKDADVQAALAAKGLDDLTGAALEQAKAQVTLELILGKSSDALVAYKDSANEAERATKDLTAQYEDAKQALAERFFPVWQEMIVLINEASDSTEGLANVLATEGIADWFRDITDSSVATGSALRNFSDGSYEANEKQRMLRQGLEESAPAWQAAADTSAQLATAIERQAAAFAAVTNPLRDYGEIIARLFGPDGAVNRDLINDLLRLNALPAGITELPFLGAQGGDDPVAGSTVIRDIDRELQNRRRQTVSDAGAN